MVLLGTLWPLLADALDMAQIRSAALFRAAVHPADGAAGGAAAVRPAARRLATRDSPRGCWRCCCRGRCSRWSPPPSRGGWRRQGQRNRVVLGVAGAAWVLAGTLRFVWSRFNAGRPPVSPPDDRHGAGALRHRPVPRRRAAHRRAGPAARLALKPGQSDRLARPDFTSSSRRKAPRRPNYLSDYGTVPPARRRLFEPDRHPAPGKRSYAPAGR